VAGCGSDDDSNAGNSQSAGNGTQLDIGTLKVGSAPYPPFCIMGGGPPTGLEPDMLDLVAERMGVDREVATTDFAGLLASVQTGRYDMGICSIYWKADRLEDGLFTDPVAYLPISIIQKKGAG